MSVATYFDETVEKHRSFSVVELLRFLLGVILVIKGINLIGHRTLVSALVDPRSWNLTFFLMSQYITGLFLIGGILIAFGMLTRIICLMEMPILIAEIFFIHLPKGFSIWNADLIYSIIILAFLIFFSFYGGGLHSADHYVRTREDE